MKRVLLLGDSIRISYQDLVLEALKDKAKIVFPEENCRFSKYLLWGVNIWIKELGMPDIVHFNAGLWDINHEFPMVEALTDLDEYEVNIRRIINELKRTGAKLIFATTTPVAEDLSERSNFEIEKYNHRAVEIMRELNIEVNDLYSAVKHDIKNNICEDKLHLSNNGINICSKKVIEIITKYI